MYTYEYDENGSRTAKKDGAGTVLQSYIYDQKRRVTSLTDNTNGTKTFNYQYDPSDYRTRQERTDYTGNYLLEIIFFLDFLNYLGWIISHEKVCK